MSRERDAERYRWLRAQRHMDIAMCWALPPDSPLSESSEPDDIDAAIDEAMRRENRRSIAAALSSADGPAAEWIPVSERLPEDGQKVLFWSRDWVAHAIPGFGQPAGYSDTAWLDDSYCDNSGDPREVYNVSHWMSLPEPPALQSQEPKP